MSGLCAVRSSDPGKLSAAANGIVRSFAADARERVVSEVDSAGGCTIGLAARFSNQSIYRGARIIVACDADIYNVGELRGSVRASGPGEGEDDIAALIAALYEKFGTGCFER